MKLTTLGFLVVCWAVLSLGAGSDAAARPGALSPRIDAYVRSMVAAREFVGSVLVARNGRLLFARGYGFADRRARVRNSPATQFRLTLATQLFNEIALRQLRDTGRLRFEDSVCRFITSCPPGWRPITVEALLQVRSGLADVRLLSRRTPPPSVTEAVAWLKRQPLRSPPLADEPDNSPAAAILLAAVVERASGQGWLVYLRNRILRPAGMTATVPDAASTGRGRAIGYLLPSFREGRDVAFTTPDVVQGLRTTVIDLFSLDRALYANRLLRASSVAELFPAGRHIVNGYHAFDSAPGRVTDGWFSIIGRHTPDRLLVVLLSNGRKLDYRFYDMENRIAAITVGLRRTKPVAAGPADVAFVQDGVLALASSDGSQARYLTSYYAGSVYSPAWSPDGRRLAFSRCRRADCDVYIINADGTNERKLGTGFGPAWSPDGRAIAVGAVRGVRLITVATGGVRILAGTARANRTAWSPDGQSILFMGRFYVSGPRHGDLRNRLMVVPAAGGRPRTITSRPGFYLISSVAWSSTQPLIAYSWRDRVGSGPGTAAAYVASVDGSNERQLVKGAYTAPRFLPDGEQIAYNVGLGCKLRLVTVTGGAARTLPFEGCEAVWRPR